MRRLIAVLPAMLAIALIGIILTSCQRQEQAGALTGGAVTGNNAAGGVKQAAGINEVIINADAIEPYELRVKAGTEVTWVKRDSERHRIMENLGTFDSSEQLYDGRAYSYKFDRAGAYEYADVLGGGVGRVIVE